MVFLYEYVWIDADGNLRGKTKVTDTNAGGNVENLPVWNYDGSSTKQAEGNNSEVLIKPQAIFVDPFHKFDENSSVEGSFLVMCDTYLPNMDPHPTNSRFAAQQTFDTYAELESRFGIEQEFFVKHRDFDGENAGRVLGFGEHQLLKPAPQGQYYCSVGSNNAFGREFIMAAFHNCLKAGLNLTGMNAEVAPGQWEFQVCADGIAAADQLYIMRYILARTGESFGFAVDFHPKPVDSVEWNGSGCHTNFSTKPMREEGGYEVIKRGLDKLSNYQELCMKNYGVDNNKRMTGELETSNFSEFSWGVANRGCSVRVPNSTVQEGKGYFEDRRPASNMDPYVVTAMLVELTLDDNKTSETVSDEEATETVCENNCDEEDNENCCDPLNKTMRDPEKTSSLLSKENPFDIWEGLPSPSENFAVSKESTTDSLTYSEDSADLSSPEQSEVDSNLDTDARVAPEESYERQQSFAEDETTEEQPEETEPVEETEPTEETESVEEEKSKSAFTSYFNLINKKD